VLATLDIRSGNWHIARDGINLLVEASEMRVQSTSVNYGEKLAHTHFC
jgi:hypothetical protein